MNFKALLVGINKYPTSPLHGCINDVTGMRSLLMEKYGVKESMITTLIDADATKAGMVKAIKELAAGTAGDPSAVRLFHYSGHGTYTYDENHDEKDGRDEALCPYDFSEKNLLVDDELATLYKLFDKRSHLLLVMDSCHSGTVQRYPQPDRIPRAVRPSAAVRAKCREAAQKNREAREAAVAKRVEARVEGLRSLTGEALREQIAAFVHDEMKSFDKKHYGLDTVAGNAVLIAGCRASQTSSDASFPGGFNGALTYHLLRLLHAGAHRTYSDLIIELGKSLDADGFEQEPQLECAASARQLPFLKH